MDGEENLKDEEILDLSQRSPKYFEILVHRYSQAFLRKVKPITKNEADANDIVQDTFVKIYLNGAKFRPVPGASFKSWAYKILLNTAFTWCKKRKREKEMILDIDPELAELVPELNDVSGINSFDRDFLLSIVS